MSLKLIIYGDIFKHGELHQGELSFFVNLGKKKEEIVFSCLTREVSLSSSRMLGAVWNVWRAACLSQALLLGAVVVPRDEKVAELRSKTESEIKAAMSDVTISCTDGFKAVYSEHVLVHNVANASYCDVVIPGADVHSACINTLQPSAVGSDFHPKLQKNVDLMLC